MPKKKKEKKRKNQYSLKVNAMDSFEKISKACKSTPNFDFDCKNCNENCCVSPYISIAEFLYVANYIIQKYDDPYKVLLRDNGIDKNGVQICPFLDSDKRCLIYNVRYYKCRMTGMDILDAVFTDVCQHKKAIGVKSPNITREQWLLWVNLLTKANKPFNYIEQLQFHSWIKFYFEDDHKLKPNQIKARDFLRNYLMLDQYIPVLVSEDLDS